MVSYVFYHKKDPLQGEMAASGGRACGKKRPVPGWGTGRFPFVLGEAHAGWNWLS